MILTDILPILSFQPRTHDPQLFTKPGLLKISIITLGKTSTPYIKAGIDVYLSRLKHYGKVELIELSDINTKGISPDTLKQKEGEAILKQVKADDVLVLLDEKGEQFSSRGFADFLQKKMNAGIKNLCLVVGGAFGFSSDVYARANAQLSLSKMTFTHEMVRLFICEQLYRAFTIQKGESYHND